MRNVTNMVRYLKRGFLVQSFSRDCCLLFPNIPPPKNQQRGPGEHDSDRVWYGTFIFLSL